MCFILVCLKDELPLPLLNFILSIELNNLYSTGQISTPFFSKSPMLQKLQNLFTLYKIIKSRGNRELISHSRKQLVDFIFCNNDLNRKSFLQVIIYWFNMLKGLDVIVWRLETFGFIYSPILNDEEKIRLNQYL